MVLRRCGVVHPLRCSPLPGHRRHAGIGHRRDEHVMSARKLGKDRQQSLVHRGGVEVGEQDDQAAPPGPGEYRRRPCRESDSTSSASIGAIVLTSADSSSSWVPQESSPYGRSKARKSTRSPARAARAASSRAASIDAVQARPRRRPGPPRYGRCRARSAPAGPARDARCARRRRCAARSPASRWSVRRRRRRTPAASRTRCPDPGPARRCWPSSSAAGPAWPAGAGG